MRVGWLVAIASLAGCGVLSGLDGLTVVGDGGVSDVTSGDAMNDAGIDVGACESGACGAPAGFQPVLFAADRGTLCPSGSTTVDAVVDPVVPPNACACECNYQPSCLPEPNSFQFGVSTCTTPITLQQQLDGGCNTINANLGNGSFHMSIGPFPPSNACTNAVKPGAKPSTPPGRMCTLADCSACAPVSGFALCYAQAGDVECPTKTMTKHSLGTDATLACSACTACSSTAKCKGTVQMFFDTACSSSAGTVTVDGTCQGFADSNINSVKYNPSVDQGLCTPGTSTASITMNAPTTVCCP